jgi:hypothetical protein
MSARDSSNTHEVIATLFRAMNSPGASDRAAASIPRWADDVSLRQRRPVLRQHGCAAVQQDCPVLPAARRRPGLDQDQPGHLRVDDPGRRGGRGARRARDALHERPQHPEGPESAVPRRPAGEAGGGGRQRRACCSTCASAWRRSRVFDPACGSGNFLVIAYKEMRAIEAEINGGAASRIAHRNPAHQLSRHRAARFPGGDCPPRAGHRRVSVRRAVPGQKLALAEFLPLRNENWITCGNALRLDWLSICPPTGTGVKVQADDLFRHAARSGRDRLRE